MGRGGQRGAVNEGWWRGQAVPAIALDHGVSVTRFVPGRVGTGLTEDLPALAARMAAEGTPFYRMAPGLWYDRRRDDHLLVRRADANVWAPFYEMPVARSGRGTAWDGLSLYDLTRYNPWYFDRISAFARLAAAHGLVVLHNLHNTHNLLETAAHWVDFPWRPANNINETGLPDPPLGPRATVHVANEFYSTEATALRELHRGFILHTLDELGGESNLLLGVGFQYAGPLAFQRFFLDTAAEWERRTGKQVRVVLTTGKALTDSILSDPVRARNVVAVDMRYWQYRPDGTLWAPEAGSNLAFREMIARDFGYSGDSPPPTTPEQAYRQVREYRDRHPHLAILAWHNEVGPVPALMAGAAHVLTRNPSAGHGQGRVVDRTVLDRFVREHLATDLPRMSPRDGLVEDPARTWVLADDEMRTVLVYSLGGETIGLAGSLAAARYRGLWFDPLTGSTGLLEMGAGVGPGGIRKPSDAEWLLLLRGPP